MASEKQTMPETVFAPAGLTLPNSAAIIADGRSKITPNGSLVVDMQNLQQCDSAAVCLLIELFRAGNKKNCQITIRNPGAQFKKMLKLYRLGKVFGIE